jgi:hypothetical protein
MGEVEAMQEALGRPGVAELAMDVANYTNVTRWPRRARSLSDLLAASESEGLTCSDVVLEHEPSRRGPASGEAAKWL